MPHPFIFLCPLCETEDSVRDNRCSGCGASVRISPDAAEINGKVWKLPALLEHMRKKIPINRPGTLTQFPYPEKLPPQNAGSLRVSGPAVLRQGTGRIRFAGFDNLFTRTLEMPRDICKGFLLMGTGFFEFLSAEGGKYHFLLDDLTCVTTNSHYLEFKMRGRPFFQIAFSAESPLKYEILFQKLLRQHHGARDRNIAEFQPRLRFHPPDCSRPVPVFPAAEIPQQILPDPPAARILRNLLKFLFRLLIRVEIHGRENLPATFPFIALLNHQSIFDPFIVLAFLDKRLAFLTKSTSFAGRLEQFVLRIGRGIPTTRYQTDPMVIRHVRRFLSRGIPVGIFPEGERSWDGQMQPFKYSVIRLLAEGGIPVVPVVIENAFAFMPRWAKFPRRKTVRFTVLPSWCLRPAPNSCTELRVFSEAAFRNILESEASAAGQ